MKWSRYQKKIFYRVEDTDSNIVIDAVAGSGKSTTLFKIASLLQDQDILFFAFNKHIEQFATKKLSKLGVKVQTTHAYGLSCMKASGKFNNATMNVSKIWDYLQANVKDYKLIGKYYSALAALRTFGCLEYDGKGIMKFVRENPTIINQIGDPKVLSYAETLGQHLKRLDEDVLTYDFDDMIRFPIIYKLIKFGYLPEVLLVDEAQDLNNIQFVYLRYFIKKDVRIIAVGDEKQAIYSFRGSCGNSLNSIRELAEAKRMPLSITYRCKSKIVEYVKAKYSSMLDDDGEDEYELPIEAFEPGGKVIKLGGYEHDPYSLGTLLSNRVEMIVSAKNKHIISIWFDLLEKYGVSSSLKGSKITAMLTKMFKNLKSEVPFYNAANALLSLKNSEDETMADMAETCHRFLTVQKFKNYDEVFARIKQLDADTKSKIHLHTVHSAKGLEDEKVFLIDDWFDSDQKANMFYVGSTRASDYLYVVKPFEQKPVRQK